MRGAYGGVGVMRYDVDVYNIVLTELLRRFPVKEAQERAMVIAVDIHRHYDEEDMGVELSCACG